MLNTSYSPVTVLDSAIFSATCFALPLRDKLSENFKVSNMGSHAIFLLRKMLHEVELRSTFRNGLQQLTTPLHSVSSLQHLVSQFYGIFNKGACAHFVFFVPKSIASQVAEKIVRCNRAFTTEASFLRLLRARLTFWRRLGVS